MLIKIKELLNRLHIRFFYIIIALIVLVLLVLFLNNQHYVIYELVPHIFMSIFLFFKNNLFDLILEHNYQQLIVNIVLFLVGILIFLLVFWSIQRELSLEIFRMANKPFNTYQYGKLNWITYHQKRKSLNRCYFDNINTQGTPVEVMYEKVLYLFGYPILLKEKPLFENKENITYKTLDAQNNNIAVDEEKVYQELYTQNKDDHDHKRWFRKIHENKKKWFGIEEGEFIYLYDFLQTPGNALFNAPTRSGKTQTIVLIFIDILSRICRYDLKPSMVLSDPKGELFDKMSKVLEARGYKVLSINCKEKEFLNTHCFNPLKKVYDEYLISFNKIKPYLDMDLIKGAKSPIAEYYRQLDALPQSIRQMFSSKPAEKLLENISTTFIPTDQGNDPFWPQNAQGWMNSVLFYMLEISILAGEPDKFSLYALITYLQSDDAFISKEQTYTDPVTNTSQTETISTYEVILKGLPSYHYSVIKLPKGVKPEQQQTFKNDIISKLNLFAGAANKITSLNNIDLDDFLHGDRPVALFLITPDMDKTYNPIVGVIIEQLYLFAAQQADSNKSKKLKRNIEFILDEFANIPKIKDMDTKVSVCLGRGIRFNMIVQNEEQLDGVYGKEIKETIKQNSLHQCFLGGNSMESCKAFSDEIGYTTKMIEQDQVGAGNKLDWRPEKVPLVTPEELSEVKLGISYHKIKSVPPIKSNLVPAFTYMGNYEQTNSEKFYANRETPHINKTENDLLFNRILNPFNDLDLNAIDQGSVVDNRMKGGNDNQSQKQ